MIEEVLERSRGGRLALAEGSKTPSRPSFRESDDRSAFPGEG